MSIFISVFAPKLEAMLDYRVACGFKRETYVPQLVKFDNYCYQRLCEKSELTSELVHGWLQSETVSIYSKVLAIRQFGKYVYALSEEAYVLPEKFTPSKRAQTPYIFTDHEMTSLFTAIDCLKGNPNEPHLDLTLPVLFRLIYTCGLRPNEGRKELFNNNLRIS